MENEIEFVEPLSNKTFYEKKELFSFLRENKEQLIAQKKAIFKKSDSFNFAIQQTNEITKELSEESNAIKVKAVINTTNLLDSHNDVHLKGLWAKSISENKSIVHLQEHQMTFKNRIAWGKDLKISIKKYTWKELGYDFDGTTEALEFESIIRKEINPEMFDLYKKGYVTNHSVGMMYVKVILCINDEGAGAEFEAWQKYYPEVVNKEQADSLGYFFAVKEAKVIEGSAVVLGSNWATPTLSIEDKSVFEPMQITQTETPKFEPFNDTLFLVELNKTLKNK